ncbi:trans-aconitate 2-methyltransferase [Bordetella pseudohinzii]|uniref:Trans-aconitate 2-methyltransferase n=1 Tax=Bordetella pseudohinzii TaxID=1331258 RepID=A0A0J6C5U5_9BORD|nr:trans-aconitate 2-methyltransferase [Bordetella pseudohinzii]ANY15090.1 trans-aconitate 2-methyltransferase [Bordetella pseudohinzii]KMM26131.1 trans-aconitate methyltransferase [Bordetella pseudohinzii]KXA79998.1 trans-aconitate methyltransferase [Bordetella pseudohinzii]KXA82860.1 trans-aconitate methyltransferase [Bordetella pseudohinzii]CUI52733.1 Trans-aconitate 2-methyltransferase [Bordetella pseudohinzii]
MSWSAKQYSAFENERTRPVRDLVAAIPTAEVRRAVDLGCGPGNSTEVLAARFPQAEVSGMDSSADMVAAARKRMPGVAFSQEDISTWNPDVRYDVILANASLQWVPDHATLYPRLLGRLAPGGSLAVQTPDNLEEPAHRLARAVASEGPWAAKLAGVRHPDRHPADWYYALLSPLAQRVDVWRTTYMHPLAGARAIVEWFKGTALLPYLNLLDEDGKAAFLARYEAAVAQAYPALPDGTVLLPFPRLFVIAASKA